MSVNPVATVTRDFLVASKRGGGGNQRHTLIAGNGVLVKNLVELVPADHFLRVDGLGGIGSGKGATFITSLVATPIQNLSNFSRGLRRLEVNRAGLGSNTIEVSDMSKGDVRTRIRISATIARLKLNPEEASKNLDVSDAFSCFANGAAAVTLTLPPATAAHVGLEYFFALDPAMNPGVLTIACRNRDQIQFRQTQKIDRRVVRETQVVEASTVIGTIAGPIANKMSVVVACRAPRLWVAESVPATVTIPDPSKPQIYDMAPLWTIPEEQ